MNTTENAKTAIERETRLVHTIRDEIDRAIAASIWKRQRKDGSLDYDFSISRSWKSLESGKTGYSENYFAKNADAIGRVAKAAAVWIDQQNATAEFQATTTKAA